MTIVIHRRALLAAGAATLAVLPEHGQTQNTAPSAVPPMPPLEAYAQSPLIDQIALSPDGKRVAIISQDGDNKVLLFYDLGRPAPMTMQMGPAKLRGLMWVDNDSVVVLSSQTSALLGFEGRHEITLGNIINSRTGKLTSLFSGMDNFYTLVAGDINRVKMDGKYLVTASNFHILGDGNFCLYGFGLDETRPRQLCAGGTDTRGFVVEPDGHVRAYYDLDDTSKDWRLYYNFAEPGKMSIYRMVYVVKYVNDWPSVEGLGRDGKSILIYFNEGDKRGEFHEVAADGSLSPILDAGEGKSVGTLFDPRTKRLAGFSHYNDWVEYDYSDPLLKKLASSLPVILGEHSRNTIVEYAEDPRKMIAYTEAPDDAGSYYFIDFSTGDNTFLASNYSHLPAEWITQKQAFNYKAADGLDIHGYLTLPPRKTATALPLIVLPHGGPEARDFGGFDWQAQILAARGYAVLQPNFRGSSGYGRGFTEAGHGEWGRKMQTDLSDGVRELVRQGIADPKRVAILGASYGGYAAMAGATLDAGVYNCAVAIAGISDVRSFIGFLADNAEAGRDSSKVAYFRRYVGDDKGYDDVSPARQAAKASCPILLIHGTDDTVVPIEQSQRMEKALKAAGKPVEFVTYKGQDHWETVGSARIEMMKAALAFLDKHNPA